jgi:hydroxymethylpyrimidine/phosphomethylpyrimidine kinase
MKTDDSGEQSTRRNSGSATIKQPISLTIAGFDPSSGAGITADLKVFSSFGIYGMACPTALTVQSTQGVRRVEPLREEMVRETLETLRSDVVFAGIKVGMLASGEVANVVADYLRRPGPGRQRLVVDPVMRSSSGKELLDPAGIHILKERILPEIGWITPNLDELAVLTGQTALEREKIARSAHILREIAAKSGNSELNILVTGGHLERPDDFLLTAEGEEVWFRGERVETTSTHGTGCALSSALLCRLILGDDAWDAVANAKAYVTSALRAAYPIGKGRGPMHHHFRFDPQS